MILIEFSAVDIVVSEKTAWFDPVAACASGKSSLIPYGHQFRQFFAAPVTDVVVMKSREQQKVASTIN